MNVIVKRLALVLLILLSLYTASQATGSFSDNEHNQWIEDILFGNPSYHSSKPLSIVNAVDQLEDAVYLCIDQFNGSSQPKGATLLKELNDYRIPGIPADISEIDFDMFGDKHRIYTHRGWHHTYYSFEIEKGHADVRKELLIAVVNYVFGFSTSDAQSQKTCDAMCCLLYNAHLLGDRYHSKAYYGATHTILLAEDSESIIHDLLECLPVLFSDQVKERNSDYTTLEQKLKKYSSIIIKERRQVNTNVELLEIDHKYSVEIKKLLAEHVPKLLSLQKWFTEVFPNNWECSLQ